MMPRQAGATERSRGGSGCAGRLQPPVTVGVGAEFVRSLPYSSGPSVQHSLLHSVLPAAGVLLHEGVYKSGLRLSTAPAY